ncbi:2173_t:CDS:1, partial [Ambispora leptoticha]
LDIEVPWPVPYPDNKKHRVIWQNGIQTAKDMFKVDGAEYAFSTWFTKAKEIDLASVILGEESEDEAIQEVFLQCLYRNYSEEEINEIIKLAKDAYRAKDKGSKNWLTYVEDQIESKKFEAGMTERRAREILNVIDNGEFLIRVKFIRDDSIYDEEWKYSFRVIDKYEPIRESKKAGGKYVGGGPNVILTKKTKPGFWVGIDEKFLVREVSEQSEVGRLDSNAVVYGLYRIRKPDVNQLMPMKDGALNCVAERVIEHFDQAKRGHGPASGSISGCTIGDGSC